MMTQVRFRSDLFPSDADEDRRVNPGRFGRRLAAFVRDGLKRAGLDSGEIVAEDWGWVVPVDGFEFGLWVACGNVYGSADEFLCFVEPHTPTVWRWFRTVDTTAAVGLVRDALDRLLVETDGIDAVRWEPAG